jgi:hypothetical protein
VDTLVQLQSRDFVTASRPYLTAASRPLSDYEISCRRLDGLPLADPIDPSHFVADDAHLHPRYETRLPDGKFRVRATLVTVNRAKVGTWYEVRVGTRYRFTYKRVKDAARAFKSLSVDNLQPYGWESNDGVPPARGAGIFGGFGRLFGIRATA